MAPIHTSIEHIEQWLAFLVSMPDCYLLHCLQARRLRETPWGQIMIPLVYI